MHQIFVGDKPIVLTTKVEKETDFRNFPLKKAYIKKAIKTLNKTDVKYVRLIGKKENKLLKKARKLLPNVIAGGGKVYNNKGEVLFIKRNKKWDLPKGRIEKNESIEEGALREVVEETGVKHLKIVKPLQLTYHVFKRNGRYRLKITHWYEMYSDYDGELVPETSEGITKVKWLNKKKIEKALKKSYANIRELV